MALPASQYRTFRDLFRIMLSVEGVGPSDADVLSFYKQLLNDASGATALSASRNFLCGEIFRRILSGNFSNPSDADVAAFWAQLQGDSSGVAAMGQTGNYWRMRQALRGSISCDGLNPSDADVLGYFSPYATQTPSMILGSQPAWWVDASAGTLVDAGGGAASAWGDSSGNGVNFSFSAGHQPSIVASGLNGKTIARFSTSQYGSAAYTSPTPGTQSSYFWAIFRLTTNVGSSRLLSLGTAGGASAIYVSTGPTINDFNGTTSGFSPVLTLGTWYRLEVYRSNSPTDYLQANGSGGTGNAGNSAQSGAAITLNADFGGTNIGNTDFAEFFEWLGTPTVPQRAALAAYSAAKWGV